MLFVDQDTDLCVAQQSRQRGFTVEGGAIPQVLTILLDEVKSVEDRLMRGVPSAQILELRNADSRDHAASTFLRLSAWRLRALLSAIASITSLLLDLRKLEAADVVAGRSVGGAAEKSGKSLNIPDIVVLRLVAEGPDGHVCDHAAAKIADRLVTHRRLPS